MSEFTESVNVLDKAMLDKIRFSFSSQKNPNCILLLAYYYSLQLSNHMLLHEYCTLFVSLMLIHSMYADGF